MEEDRDDARVMLRDHIGLDNPAVCSSPQIFFQRRDKFWKRMAHRGAVSRVCCDKVMQMIKPFHKIWTRRRHVNHSGATRDFYRWKKSLKVMNKNCLKFNFFITSFDCFTARKTPAQTVLRVIRLRVQIRRLNSVLK